ncbi:NADH-quinone oxidoreductase subunit C [Streptomyces sp. NPDC093085]|uniref:NADH-quinone oxidoreductase subunit C n=1 Tax=Streptomyces sp. NPDC093085 TaxID=3155068 RepID=UPI003437ADEA
MYGRLPEAAAELFGEGATAEAAYDLLTVDVPAASWLTALETARTTLGCDYFDWLSAVDEPGTGFRVCAHVAALVPGAVRRLLVRTTVPHDAPALPTAVGIYAGAGWHERETYEMFGVAFTGHPNLVPLLLPEEFEGHPLRKDFVLAARVAKAWPGAKEPGEPEHGGPKRRQMLPPGVPDPNEWGPLKGQLPPAPARPARGARAGAAADRPARRPRPGAAAESAGTGSGTGPGAGTGTGGAGTGTEGTPGAAPARPRRSRSVSEGSASQHRPERPEQPERPERPARPATPDAPWHQPAPSPEAKPEPAPEPKPAPEPEAPEAPAAPRKPQEPQEPQGRPDPTEGDA